MMPSALLFIILSLVCATSRAFTTTLSISKACAVHRSVKQPSVLDSSSNDSENEEIHPAVVGWPDKYVAEGGSPDTKDTSRVISDTFEVHEASDSELKELDVEHWPTWTTGDKPKWDVGNQVVDKEMPYGELSYMIRGRLEIIPQSSQPIVVKPGDLVTFPKGFVASWKVLEELTWHYYLY